MIRVPGTWGVPEGALYEEITEPGDVAFEWPDAPPGSKVTYDLAQAPADSTATATLSGAIDGADLPGAYVLERTCTHMGQVVRKDIAVAFFDGGDATDLTAPTEPAPQALAASATTASATWTHPGAPAGTTYACAAIGSDGSTPTATGSGLGAWTWPVAAGVAYQATLTATGTDGQTAQSSALVAVAASGDDAGAWTEIGRASFLGATEQTFTTTGDKTVVLADEREITVNASMSVGTISGCNVGVDAERGLVCDVPAGLSSHAPRVRVALPVSPSVAATDDLLVSILWRCTQPTSVSTTSRALVGVTTSSGTEASTEFSGMVLQHTNPDGANIQSRKDSTVSTVAAAPSGWRNGSVLMQTDIRVTSGSVRTMLATATSRDVSTEAATYVADIGGPPFGPLASTAAALFQGATIYPLMYSWNGGASGPAVDSAIEEIVVYKRATSRVP